MDRVSQQIGAANVKVDVVENGKTVGSRRLPASIHYVDHQPGDATRYEVLAVDLLGKGIHLGNLGYVGEDAIVIVCGMEGHSSAAIFKRGQWLNEMDISERLNIRNEHTMHHIGELVAALIEGHIACHHNVREAP